MAGRETVPSGVTRADWLCPPMPARRSIVARRSSSFVLTFKGVTVMAGIL